MPHLVAALLALIVAAPAAAHSTSDAFVQIDVAAESVQVRWDIALRDLDLVLPLDRDGDRRLTWGELRAMAPQVPALLAPHLVLPGCPLQPHGQALETRSDGTYLALSWQAACTLRPPLALQYTWLAEHDESHRALVQVRWPDGRVEAQVRDPQAAPQTAPRSWFAEGLHHIVGGVDHLLFLACLLLPALRLPLRESLRTVVGVVTLFTLAHSATLALAVLGWVSVAPSFVEPTIAATIVVAAVDNVRPLFGRWRAAVTFGFGLVHGLGFAGVLAELSLPPGQLGWSLLQFNLGIEAGQIAIVALAVPLGRALAAGRPRRERALVLAGSLLAGAVAAVWFVQRLS